MKKNKLTTIVAVLFLVIIFVTIVSFLTNNNKTLINPWVKEIGNKSGQAAVSPATPAPPNAPKDFKYGPSTDLKQELDNINPQVLDSDFE